MLRASKAGVWVNCPGMVGMEASPPEENEIALEGNLCHALMAAILKGEVPKNVTIEYLLENAWKGKDITVVTDDLLTLIKEVLSLCAPFCYPGYQVEIPLAAYLPEGLSGTSDLVSYDPKGEVLHVMDYKFGYKSVAAKGNWQLVIYSMGAYLALSKPPFREVHLHIFQPRDFVNGVHKVWKLRWFEWERQRELVLEAKTLAEGPRAKLKTGSHCQDCESKFFCRPFLSRITSLLEVEMYDPEDFMIPSDCYGPVWDYLVKTYAVVRSVKNLFEQQMVRRIKQGHPVKGWQVSRGSGRSVWSAPIADIKAVGDMCGVPLTREAPIKITDARKNAAARLMIEPLISKTAGSEHLVPFNRDTVKEVFK